MLMGSLYQILTILHSLPEPDLELVLPDELKESLRLLKPEGNLVKDRFRSMLVRGKVETRKKMQHKKAQVEYTEKWTYKDFK
jgi:nucleolar protein 53